MEIPRHIPDVLHPEDHIEMLASFFDELKQNHANHFEGIEFSDLGDEELTLLEKYRSSILTGHDLSTYRDKHLHQKWSNPRDTFIAGLSNLITPDSLRAQFAKLKESRKNST